MVVKGENSRSPWGLCYNFSTVVNLRNFQQFAHTYDNKRKKNLTPKYTRLTTNDILHLNIHSIITNKKSFTQAFICWINPGNLVCCLENWPHFNKQQFIMSECTCLAAIQSDHNSLKTPLFPAKPILVMTLVTPYAICDYSSLQNHLPHQLI